MSKKVHTNVFHFGKQHYRCGICSKTVMQRALSHHLVSHIGTENEGCIKCGRQRSHMTDHMMDAHVDIDVHKCARCSRSFSHEGTLFLHQQSHDSSRSHACGKCGSRFLHSYQALRHIKKHRDEDKFLNGETNMKVPKAILKSTPEITMNGVFEESASRANSEEKEGSNHTPGVIDSITANQNSCFKINENIYVTCEMKEETH